MPEATEESFSECSEEIMRHITYLRELNMGTVVIRTSFPGPVQLGSSPARPLVSA